MMRMNGLKPGETGVVGRAGFPRDRAAELMRLGLAPGTAVRCLRRSPLGDPTAYVIRGTVFALRAEDTGRIPLISAGGAP